MRTSGVTAEEGRTTLERTPSKGETTDWEIFIFPNETEIGGDFGTILRIKDFGNSEGVIAHFGVPVGGNSDNVKSSTQEFSEQR